MRISDAKSMLTSVFAYNMEQMEKGLGHKNFILPMLEGEPGVGKTAAIGQVAEELGVPLHTTIIAGYDAGELGGFGIPTDVIFENEDGSEFTEKRVIRARPDYMPDPRTADGIVGFWNLDELPQAVLTNQNICSQLVNTWRLGEHEISPGITIVATGNKAEHKAGTTSMPMHLRDRLMFVTIEANNDDFDEYAVRKGLDYRLRAFLKTNPSCLQKFQIGVKAFPSCRSWEKASAILSMKMADHIQRECLWGQIGEAMTAQFEAYFKVADRMPKWQDIIANPLTAPVFGNEDADILYMLLANLVEVATEKNIEAEIAYVERLPNQEFTAMWNKDVCNRHPKLLENKHITNFKLRKMTKIVV